MGSRSKHGYVQVPSFFEYITEQTTFPNGVVRTTSIRFEKPISVHDHKRTQRALMVKPAKKMFLKSGKRFKNCKEGR